MPKDLFIKEISLKRDKIENYNQYPFSLPIIRHLDTLKLSKNVSIIVGENGSGKSTLLEAIAVNLGFNPEGGTKNFVFSSYDTHSPLFDYVTVTKGYMRPKDGFFLRAESFYNVASYIEKLDMSTNAPIPLKDYYGGSLHEKSHGESFISLVQNRFGGNGLYILDEPEAALSPSRQLTLMVLINNLVKKNSQFIIATHSPILLAFPDADIFVLSEEGISKKPYYETEHYMLTKQFLNNPERILKELFK